MPRPTHRWPSRSSALSPLFPISAHIFISRDHVSILYVDQEAHGDDTPAIQCVLSADVWREKFLRDERDLNATLNDDSVDEKTKEKASEKLGEVHRQCSPFHSLPPHHAAVVLI